MTSRLLFPDIEDWLNVYRIFNTGPIGDVPVRTYARSLDGKLAYIDVVFNSKVAGNLLRVLKERHGPPFRSTKKSATKACVFEEPARPLR
jgi:hypothetical protein